jgi:hypothetical protein
MLKKIILPALLLATTTFATTDSESASVHTASGKATHDGDYVNFDIYFEASCYNQQHLASGAINENVKQFSNWLDEVNENYDSGRLSYNIELINTWRQEDNYYGPHHPQDVDCLGRYSASQYVKITLTKPIDASSLSTNLVQDFYNQIQLALTSYWYNSVDYGSSATAIAKVIDVEKGLFDDTVDLLRRKAKYLAQSKATKDFLSLLGDSYSGMWYLDRADFSDRQYSYELTEHAVLPKNMDGSNFVPAQLKLRPLSITAVGTFVFRFERSKNYHGN